MRDDEEKEEGEGEGEAATGDDLLEGLDAAEQE